MSCASAATVLRRSLTVLAMEVQVGPLTIPSLQTSRSVVSTIIHSLLVVQTANSSILVEAQLQASERLILSFATRVQPFSEIRSPGLKTITPYVADLSIVGSIRTVRATSVAARVSTSTLLSSAVPSFKMPTEIQSPPPAWAVNCRTSPLNSMDFSESRASRSSLIRTGYEWMKTTEDTGFVSLEYSSRIHG